MSTSRQAIRKRKKAVIKKRYSGLRCADAATSRRLQDAKVRREMDRQLRARKKK